MIFNPRRADFGQHPLTPPPPPADADPADRGLAGADAVPADRGLAGADALIVFYLCFTWFLLVLFTCFLIVFLLVSYLFLTCLFTCFLFVFKCFFTCFYLFFYLCFTCVLLVVTCFLFVFYLFLHRSASVTAPPFWHPYVHIFSSKKVLLPTRTCLTQAGTSLSNTFSKLRGGGRVGGGEDRDGCTHFSWGAGGVKRERLVLHAHRRTEKSFCKILEQGLLLAAASLSPF